METNSKRRGHGAAESSSRHINTAIAASVIAASTLLSPMLRAGDSASSDAKPLSLYYDINGGLTYEQSVVKTVGNIPFSIRNVPVNPADSWAAGNDGPISQTSLNPSDRVSVLAARLGAQASSKRFEAKGGLSIDLIFNVQSLFDPNNRTDIAERDYEAYAGSNIRGAGTALTYIYAGERYLANWNTFLRPSLFGEASLNLSESTSLSFGCKLFEQTFYLENGWDRYDSLQTRQTYPAANYVVVTPSVSFCYKDRTGSGKVTPYLEIGVGTSQIINKSYTSLGSQLTIEENKFPILGFLQVGLNF